MREIDWTLTMGLILALLLSLGLFFIAWKSFFNPWRKKKKSVYVSEVSWFIDPLASARGLFSIVFGILLVMVIFFAIRELMFQFGIRSHNNAFQRTGHTPARR
jgi:hypothetical protein